MVSAAITGFLTAVLVIGIQSTDSLMNGHFPLWILGAGLVAWLLHFYVLTRRPGSRFYNGLTDLFIQIHSPGSPDSSVRWFCRGVISFLLSIGSGGVGPEGPAMEASFALTMRGRSRSARWFEQRRRTDSSSVLSAGISAAFGAPFAGVLLPVELGMGGRAISSAVSAVIAYLTTRFLLSFVTVDRFDLGGATYGFGITNWREWAGAIAIGLVCGGAGVFLIRFVRYSEESLARFVRGNAGKRILIGTVLLTVLIALLPQGRTLSTALLEDLAWARLPVEQAQLLLFAKLIGVALIMAAFGTLGLFWPVFLFGGGFAFLLDQYFLQALPGFTSVAVLAGGASLWAVVFGAPVAGAVLAFEMSQNAGMLLPCLVAAWVARGVAHALRTQALVDHELRARGISLIGGRSLSILNSLVVREAMVTDFQVAHESESLAQLQPQILDSKYPFIPVIKGEGEYRGLLTIDMLQEAVQSGQGGPLSQLLEVKDLLYRSGFKTPSVKSTDCLAATHGMFDDLPCVPVVSEDGKLEGLLFADSVRLAYDRAVARRSLEGTWT